MTSLRDQMPLKIGVRDAVDDDDQEILHLECRFPDGQKFAAVQISSECELLAHVIACVLNNHNTTVAQVLKLMKTGDSPKEV